uniref:agamous-like MADS-box protein AGL61 n=1 Tax=Fragaria vesca subsp. vesca TaxID=101020 RepID=UPI0005C8696D|nr:PREDICTED: agamous-like MADS-box protein AGL61 [Fragaria vesca subsp. vesca]
MGRKKIEIKKITNRNALKVTCTKRRTGLIRKAKDFCAKTGAQIAIITFSPGMQPKTFGNPSVESVIDRYELYEKKSSNDKEMLDEDRGLREVGLSDEENEMLEGMTLNELKQYARSIEEQTNKFRMAWQIQDRKRRESSTVDLFEKNACGDLTIFGVKVGEKNQKMETEDMKRRESCTKDFLSTFN